MTTTPYSEGSPDAKICVVAEAPARSEIMNNRPLVGESGQVFNEILHNAGLIRNEISIANYSRDRLSDADKGELLTNRGLTEKGKAYAADLRERLKHHKANVFVAMGNLALAALTDQYGKDRGITRLRGSVYPSSLLPGKKVIPTIHPAATLPGRGPYINRYTISHDFRKAKRHSEFPDLRLPQRELVIYPKYHDLQEFVALCRSTGRFGFDIETLNFHVSCISLAPHPNLSMSIPFYGDYWRDPTLEASVWRLLGELMEDPGVEKICQFGTTFDIPFLMLQNAFRFKGKITDVGTKHRVLHPDFSAKLEYLTSVYTDEPFYKDDRKLWSRPSKDPDTFYRYNAKDSAVTIECDEPIDAELRTDEAATWTYEYCMSLLDPCLYAMMRGVRVDHDQLETTREEVAESLAAAEKALEDEAEVPFNPHSSAQVIKYFYGIKGVKPYISRKTGRPTCDDTALARIVRRDNLPEARMIQEIRSLAKLKSTYLELNLDKDGRLRCVYDPRGTYTGRLSSKKTPIDTGMNLQNLHPVLRAFIKPDAD